jgi:hypothetical protein
VKKELFPYCTPKVVENVVDEGVWFAKTLADFEISEIAALPPLFCYNS